MKICIVSREYPPLTAWGGIATYAYNLAHGLSTCGHEVHVVSFASDSPSGVYYDHSVVVHRIRPSRIFAPLSVAGLPRVCSSINYSWAVNKYLGNLIEEAGIEIVEFPEYSAEGFVYLLHNPKIAVVVHLHLSSREIVESTNTANSLDLRALAWLESSCVRRASQVVAYSDFSVARSSALFGNLLRPVKRIYPALQWRSSSLSSTRKTPALNILFVGRLSVRKGTETLLRAIPEVLKVHPEVSFVLVGNDQNGAPGSRTFEKYFREDIADELCLQRTQFVPHSVGDSLTYYYQSCDIFVAPSLYETFGFVHLEAMSHGKPVIACHSSATPEVVVDGQTGLLIEPCDTSALAQAILKLVESPQLRQSMGRAGYERASAYFTISNMVQQTLDTYEKCIELRSTGT